MVGREPSEQERFEVLLEQMRHEFDILADGHVTLDQKIDRLAHESAERDAALDQKIDFVVQRFNQRFDTLDETIDRVAQELSKKMDAGFAGVRAAVHTLAQHLHERVRSHAG